MAWGAVNTQAHRLKLSPDGRGPWPEEARVSPLRAVAQAPMVLHTMTVHPRGILPARIPHGDPQGVVSRWRRPKC